MYCTFFGLKGFCNDGVDSAGFLDTYNVLNENQNQCTVNIFILRHCDEDFVTRAMWRNNHHNS